MMNQTLSAAKVAKKDEFYTQYVDIEKEVQAYLDFDEDTFRDKVVYCNCDDPFESNFFKYFASNFNRFGLKKLIATSYDGSPYAGTQLGFSEYGQGNGKRQKPRAVTVEIDEVRDVNGDGVPNIEDVELFLKNNPHTRTSLVEGGDFRSDESIALLKEADIVVTNPPFSLFREYVAQLAEHKKHFLIIGTINAITYKNIFSLIKENKIWLGYKNGYMEFKVPGYYEPRPTGYREDEDGQKWRSLGNTCWFTNLYHGRRCEKLKLMTMKENLRYSTHKNIKGKTAYARYDNFDAIEIPFIDWIPRDYDGIMGVPISFFDKYNPEQFEVLGRSENKDLYGLKTRVYTTKECQAAYRRLFGKKGTYDMNATPVLDGRKVYQRIFIRSRAQPAKRAKK